MKWLAPLAQLIALLIESYARWRDRKAQREREWRHDQIDDDPDAALRDRDWLRNEGGDGADVPDQPNPEHRAD